jgi:AFG3 family protein
LLSKKSLSSKRTITFSTTFAPSYNLPFLMFIRSMISGAAKGNGAGGKGGLSGLFENTKSHRFRPNITLKFNDVVGMNKAEEEIVECIDFLKNADKYNRLGAKIPR